MSHDGGKLVKEFNDGRIVSVSASTPVTPANRIDHQLVPSNLDRQFYINEAYKQIHNVMAQQSNQLVLF